MLLRLIWFRWEPCALTTQDVFERCFGVELLLRFRGPLLVALLSRHCALGRSVSPRKFPVPGLFARPAAPRFLIGGRATLI